MEGCLMDAKLKAFVINLLRKGTFKHKPRGEAKKRFKVKVGEFKTGRAKYGYKCLKCEGIHKSKDIKMDHKKAVVCPIVGFVGFDVYIERMFCDEDNFIALCDPCHDEKTAFERDFRKRSKDAKAVGDSVLELFDEYREFLKEYEET